MLTRRRTVLKALAEAGGSLGKLDLFKLLFLVDQEEGLPREAAHEFVPYLKGPYSFTLAHDLKNLETAGLVTQTEKGVAATAAGLGEASRTPETVSTVVKKTLLRHRQRDTWALVDHVYAAFPWYTINSEWTARRAMPRPVAKIAVYTIGYECVQVDGLLNRLMEVGIQTLIDVRFNPVARRYGFHRSTLAGLCPKVGIEYLHRPELGIPGTWRGDLGSPESYRSLFWRYEREVLPLRDEALQAVLEIMLSRPSALMCKEADPTCCHRTTLARELSARSGLPVNHLNPKPTDEEMQFALL